MLAAMLRSLFVGLALVVPEVAWAQRAAISRYNAPPWGEDLSLTERARVGPHLNVGAQLVLEYTHRLNADVVSRGPVSHRVTAHATASLGLFDRAQLALTLPVVATQSLADNTGATALGDARLDARVRLIGLPRGGGLRLGVATTLVCPTGDRDALTGDGGFGLVPRVLFELSRDRGFVFALNLGVALRFGWQHQMFARVGVTLPVASRVSITLEGALETRLTDPSARNALVFEALGGLLHVARGGFALRLAAGPAIVEGEGAANVRVLAGVGYAPQFSDVRNDVGDRDLDGVLDPDDGCPDEPAGERPDPRRRGCPIGDRDHDGFRDEVDQCPDAPAGDDPDPRRTGCPRDDQDHDGVRDPEDACPIESAGTSPDPVHRGCPLRDGDGDGVPDGDDLCPLEAAGRHPDVARRGCPDPDIDHDEIPNERDACPEERGPRTQDPRTHGCPRVYVTAERVVITQQPRFAVDRDVILPVSVPLLMEVAAVLEAHPELTRIEVQGHTDDVGDDAHNTDLSQRRAQSITQWLVVHGIAASRLDARGYGESVPLADNRTAAGRAQNRRVEFVVRERRTE
jgi:outer membrane protein OmpA-like peptidoglycan-associated protein